jgi:hypothetical protein
MSYNDLQSKTEAAGKSLVDALGISGLTVNSGASDQTKALPLCVVVCEGLAEPAGLPQTGIYRGALRFRVKDNANDVTLSDHRARVAQIFDAVSVDNLASQLSAAVAGFTCQAAFNMRQESTITDNQSWVTDLLVEVVVSPSDL